LEDSLAVMVTITVVAEAQAQEAQGFQHQVPVAELAFQVQFLEA
jgi:hypothetical protein